MDFTSFSNIINGKQCGARESYHGINPATEETLWDVPCAVEADLDRAVAAAQGAFHAWSLTTFEDRCDMIKRYAEAFLTYEREFLELLMKETGKPVSFTVGPYEVLSNLQSPMVADGL